MIQFGPGTIDHTQRPRDTPAPAAPEVGRREAEAVREQCEEQLAPVGARCRQLGPETREALDRLALDAARGGCSLLGRAACILDQGLQLAHAIRALAQLRHDGWDVVGHGDSLGELALFAADGPKLLLHRRDAQARPWRLRRHLAADLSRDQIEHLVAEHVPLDVRDEGVLHLVHRLEDRHRTRPASREVVPVAGVRLDPRTFALRERASDRAAALPAFGDAAERVLRRGAAAARWRATDLEPVLDREPRLIVDDAPFGDVDDDNLSRCGVHAHDGAGAAELLDLAVEIDPAVARVLEHLADRARHPRASARSGDAIAVETASDRLEAASVVVLAEDALDDRCLRLVEGGDREASPASVRLALQAVAVAATTRDASRARTRAECLARARPDRLQLHLVPGALHERHRLIHGVREPNGQGALRVVVELHLAIAHQFTHCERHFERIATEATLIAAHDDIARSDCREQPM